MLFSNKIVLIPGGTGSLGKTLVRQIMTGKMGKPKKVIIFSRDEDKQHWMKVEWKNMQAATDEIFYQNFDEILNFRIGDVKDYESMVGAVKEAEIIIDAVALKQVPVCEYFPFESVKTNIIGTQNLIRAVKEHGRKVEVVLGVSTDKACKPVNTYGMCKAIMERLLIQANLGCSDTKFICVRYGNVAASRGSVIPLFKDQIRKGGPVTITTKNMTRFLLTLDTAVDIVFDALRYAKAGEIYVPDVPSANILDLAKIMIGGRDIDIEYIGMRPGEKIHEILLSEEELPRTIKRNKYYVIYPILPELHKETITKPVLKNELSSYDHVMSKDNLKAFLQCQGHLDI